MSRADYLAYLRYSHILSQSQLPYAYPWLERKVYAVRRYQPLVDLGLQDRAQNRISLSRHLIEEFSYSGICNALPS